MGKPRRWRVVLWACPLVIGGVLTGAGGARLGGEAAGGSGGSVLGAASGRDERPMLWVCELGSGAESADAGGVSASGRAASMLAGVLLPSQVGAESLPGGGVDDRAVLQVGLNLSAYRRAHGDEFADDRLNRALHVLGIANAREVVVSIRPAADARRPLVCEVLIASRSRPPGEFTRLEVSMPGPRLPAGGSADRAGEVWIAPRWAVWLERCMAFHRATLTAEEALGFDERVREWRVRDGGTVRGIFAALDGPIVVTSGATPGTGLCVLIGLGARADAGILTQVLPAALRPLCVDGEGGSTYDAEASIGRVRAAWLSGTESAVLGWTIIERRGGRWLLVAREEELGALRAELVGRP